MGSYLLVQNVEGMYVVVLLEKNIQKNIVVVIIDIREPNVVIIIGK